MVNDYARKLVEVIWLILGYERAISQRMKHCSKHDTRTLNARKKMFMPVLHKRVHGLYQPEATMPLGKT